MIIIQVTNKVFVIFFHQNKSCQILIFSNIQIFLRNRTFMTVKFISFHFSIAKHQIIGACFRKHYMLRLTFMIIIQVTNKVFAIFFHQNKSCQVLILSNIQIFLRKTTLMEVKFNFFVFNFVKRQTSLPIFKRDNNVFYINFAVLGQIHILH